MTESVMKRIPDRVVVEEDKDHAGSIDNDKEDDDEVYHSLVIDSGPLIRLSVTTSHLWKRAARFYTVPAVLQEIRDAKARAYIDNIINTLPCPLIIREASPRSVQIVSDFARQTGDYSSLSAVDVQVLGLVYDLEREASSSSSPLSNGNGNGEGVLRDLSHIRTSPKQRIQNVQFMSRSAITPEAEIPHRSISSAEVTTAATADNKAQVFIAKVSSDEEEMDDCSIVSEDDSHDASTIVETSSHDDHDDDHDDHVHERHPTTKCPHPATSWARIVDPNVLVGDPPQNHPMVRVRDASSLQPSSALSSSPAAETMNVLFQRLDLRQDAQSSSNNAVLSSDDDYRNHNNVDSDNDDPNAVTGQFSDAEEETTATTMTKEESEGVSLGLESGTPYQQAAIDELPEIRYFPSLTTAMTAARRVDQIQSHAQRSDQTAAQGVSTFTTEEEDHRKQQSLLPLSKSGKLYNSFRKYGYLMKPTRPVPSSKKKTIISHVQDEETNTTAFVSPSDAVLTTSRNTRNESRIIGSGMAAIAGQEMDVMDDGEGWITCTGAIQSMKANLGRLDPASLDGGYGAGIKSKSTSTTTTSARHGPPIRERCACATTDFAMQNVLLQMNFELVSVEGMKIRKLKSFVTRCGACFKVYTSDECTGPLGKRLFCDKCGSDMMQRIAASVDGKTGRLRLHLSKRYKHNLRGTKYSLPKPGTGDRFKGDLLLREDQLLMGAWNQKVKMSSGGKARASAQSMFGKDIAANMGCNAKSLDDDFRVGFGRRNPNAVKGRERRGKRKKETEKACGLRRY